MIGRSRPQSRDSAQGTAITVVSLVMLIAAGVSNAYAHTESAPAAWIKVGTGTGPAKVSVRAASASGATVTIEIPGIQTEQVAINGAQYLKLAIPGAVSAVLDVGKPEVPAIPVLLARPTGSAVTLTILSTETETLDIARVYPMQPPQKLGEQAGPLVVDASFYASDVDYPSGRLSSPSLATWRDLDVVNVHVYPVVVRPAQHEVIVTTRITFRADFSGGRFPTKVASWMQPMYRRLIRNYDNLRFATTSIEPPGTKCLILCFYPYADNPDLIGLRDTMNLLGDSAEIIIVGGSVGIPADTEDIKNAILDRYVEQDSVLRWVFLVGECSEIPPRANYEKDTIWPRPVPYSDYWYSDLTEGHPDSCDNYPEVGIARLSPGGSGANQDLSSQVLKIMDYMMGRDTTGGWLNSITLVAHRDTLYPKAVRGVDTMTLSYYDYKRDTIMGCWGGFDNGDIVRAIDTTGTGVLIYLGHGEWDRWWAWNIEEDSWRIQEVLDLENQHTPVVFNFACGCGDLGLQTCLSEQWMRKFPGGAVASFGSSDHESWAEPNCSECAVSVRAIGDTLAECPVFDLGGIKMLMDADIATQWGNDTTWKACYCMNIYSFMWLGNPAMQVWSGGSPQAADVTYPSWIPTGSPQPFTVTVKIDNDNVEGAQVCVRKDGDFYIVGTTDASGEVTFTLNAASEDFIHVSASKGHCADQPHTPMLPYFGTSYAGANGPEMTYPNWGRKLIRDPSTSTLHVVYTNTDSVFYTASTDAGDNWSAAEPIGAGSYPASALVLNGLVPWVAYLTPDGSIMRAIRHEGHSPLWDTATIFQGNPANGTAGAPSLAPSSGPLCIGYAGVTYPVCVSPDSNYVYFNEFTELGISPPETVDAAGSESCYSASIACTPGYALQVAWTRDSSVYYRQRLYNAVWSDLVRISSSDPQWPPVTEPASHPSVECYGDSVFCVWRGPDSLGISGDVWRRSRYLTWWPWEWADATNQSKSPDVMSDFPVMTTSFATVWHEQVSSGNTDIWGRFLPDSAPEPFFQTSLLACYPQVDGYWILSQQDSMFMCNTVWTEQTSSGSPPCTLAFGVHDWNSLPGMALGPGPREDYEPASYYAAELGQPKQSPYCLARGGFAQFESWNADTSATGLTYQLPYLDPRRTYKLRAVLYHEGEGTWKADLQCDSGPRFHAKVDPGVPDTVWIQVPKRCYQDDARIVVQLDRATGEYVSLAKLKLFQIEEETRGSEGVQSWGTGRTFVTRLRSCSPNPFARTTTISYELGNASSVMFTLADATGRAVRCLAAGPQNIGFHSTVWDGKDARGRKLPAGVYFCRMQAGGTTATRRITLIR